MIRRDYVLRMIEQFFALLRRVLHLREERRLEEALALVRQGYRSFLAMDDAFVDARSARELLELVDAQVIQPEQLAMAARFLREEADLLESLELPDEARRRRGKALSLALALTDEAEDLERFTADLDPLLEQASEGLNLDERRLVFRRHVRKGRFARAEDELFQIAEAAPADDPIFDEGEAFYARLGAVSEERLIEGGLTGSEAAEGLADFKPLRSRRQGL